MQNSRYFFVTIAALVLITVSIVFISIWGYRAFIAGNTHVIRDTVYAQLSDTSQKTPARESLQPIINDPSIQDTLELHQKLLQLEQLQAEIKMLLENRKTPDTSGTDKKIKKLEKDIQLLEQRNKSVIAYNRRLERTVNKLVKSENAKPITEEKSTIQSVVELPVKISNVSLYALNNELAETTDASGTNILRGSFFVKASGISSGELIVVVMGPDGKVVISGPWQSGYFDTPDGRKLYSTKLHFEKPEQRLNFSINTENLKQGTYVLQIFYKGNMIASLRKSLS